MKTVWLLPLLALAMACGASDDDGSSEDALVVKNTTAYEGAYKSPSIVRDDTTYHAYFAGSTLLVKGNEQHVNIPHATFDDKDVWSKPNEALPKLGKGADPNGATWAPAAAHVGNHWMLYYTATLAGHGQKKCIWRAHSANPEGPFVDDFAGPLVCPADSEWALDAYVVRDLHDRWILGMRYDLGNSINSIQIRQLTDDGEDFAQGSQFMELTQNHQNSWDQHVMENAGIVRLSPPNSRDPGNWFVFYSARHWDDDSYAIGVADCGATLLDAARGECTKLTPTGPWMQTDAKEGLFGPGTPTFYTDTAGRKLMSIQAWRYDGGVAPKSPNRDKNRQQGQIMRTYEISIDKNYEPQATLVRIDM